MSAFCDITDETLQKEFNILKGFERQTLALGKGLRASHNTTRLQERRNFSAHPKRICSDLDTSPSASPCLDKINSSFSDLDLSRVGQPVYQQRKEKAQTMHKKLHEKLSLIDRRQISDSRSEFSDIGDGFMAQSKIELGEKFRTADLNYDSSESSDDLDRLESPPCRNYQKTQKETANNPSTVSMASKRTNSRFSTAQNSLVSRGLPSSIFEKKYKMICEKSLQSLNDIRTLLSKGKPSPDGEEDMNRRETRVKEFFNRFSRNYLYPLVRQLEDLYQPTHSLPLFNQKMLSAYQYVHHGLQAYHSHLPTSTGDCCGNQFRAMMENLVELCEIHRRHVGNGDEEYVLEFIDTFKINAELAIQKIQEFLSRNAGGNDTKTENLETLTKNLPSNNKRQIGNNGKKNSDKRFAMYSKTAAFRKDANWKRAVENLAKKKFNVKSKYRTASYKHRPPVQKEPEVLCLPKFPFYGPPKKSGLLKNSPVGQKMNDDNITTMIQVDEKGGTYGQQNEGENKSEHEATNKEELLVKLLQWTLKNHQSDTKDNQKSDLTDILNLVQKEDSSEFLKKVLDSLKDDENGEKKENGQQLTLEIVKSHTSIPSDDGSRPQSQRKEPKITISGEKNARLYCITDENSLLEPCSDDDEEKIQTKNTNCQTDQPKQEPKPKIIIRTSSETQTDVKTHDVTEALTKATQKGKNPTTVKISRLKKTGRPLQQLQKKYAVDIIQYKLDFYRHCKNNPMYKRTTNCQPCILMGKISEDILNESLLEVAREIEVNDIAERVYKAELTL